MRTPSKINLFLRVAGRRSDGYHELETLFYPLSEPADEVSLGFDPAQTETKFILESEQGACAVPATPDNLCIRALNAFCSAASLPAAPHTVTLKKNIPVAAGMGGGSSDAAAVLRLLKNLYPDAAVDLPVIAKKLGADVPFFLHPVPSVATGIGEKLTALEDLPERLPILIAAPQFPISAKWAYQHWDRRWNQEDLTLAELLCALRKCDFEKAAAFLRNDLEYAARKKFPLLDMIADEFKKTGACRVMMTGSGPTLFAMYGSFSLRDAAAGKLEAAGLHLKLIKP